MSVNKITPEELENLKNEMTIEKDIVAAMNFFNETETLFPLGGKEVSEESIQNEPVEISSELYETLKKINSIEEV